MQTRASTYILSRERPSIGRWHLFEQRILADEQMAWLAVEVTMNYCTGLGLYLESFVAAVILLGMIANRSHVEL